MKYGTYSIFVVMCGLFLPAIVCAQGGFDPSDVYISGKTRSAQSSESEEAVPSDDEYSAQPQEPRAEVLFISGTVELKLAGQDDYVEAEEGLYLQAGDQIKTAADSYTELGFDEAESNIVRLDEDSYATLILQGGEYLSLLQGRAFATIENVPASSSFEIRTPTAIVGVRGTDWLTAVEDDSTDVEVYDGSPYIKSMEEDGTFSRKETVVTAGYKTQIKRFRPPVKPQKIPAERLQQWKNKRAIIRQNARDTRLKRKEIPGFKRRIQIKERLQKPPQGQPGTVVAPQKQPAPQPLAPTRKRPLLPKRLPVRR